MQPHIPEFKRPPNKFLRYEQRPFEDRSGHSGFEVVAIYLNKKGVECEMVAQVKWN